MDKPFLTAEYAAYSAGHTAREALRDKSIAGAVEAYLAAQEGDPIPGQEDPEVPEPLEWLYQMRAWRDIYGQVPLRAGGLEDQPCRFTRDLEAAIVGERRREAIKVANVRNRLRYEADKGNEGIQ